MCHLKLQMDDWVKLKLGSNYLICFSFFLMFYKNVYSPHVTAVILKSWKIRAGSELDKQGKSKWLLVQIWMFPVHCLCRSLFPRQSQGGLFFSSQHMRHSYNHCSSMWPSRSNMISQTTPPTEEFGNLTTCSLMWRAKLICGRWARLIFKGPRESPLWFLVWQRTTK